MHQRLGFNSHFSTNWGKPSAWNSALDEGTALWPRQEFGGLTTSSSTITSPAHHLPGEERSQSRGQTDGTVTLAQSWNSNTRSRRRDMDQVQRHSKRHQQDQQCQRQVAFGLITQQNIIGGLTWVQANREAFTEKCFRTKSSILAYFEPHNTKHWVNICDHTAALCPKPESKWLSDAGLASVSVLIDVKWEQQHWISAVKDW